MVAVLQSSQNAPKILNIPPEVLVHIFSHLEWNQLLRINIVCRVFHDIVSSSLELRYIIELGADQLVHNPHFNCPLTIHDRLNLLLDRRRRWRTLDWTQSVPIPLPGSCQAYELVGGVFAKSMRGGGFDDPLSPNSRHFMAVRLPTRETNDATELEESENTRRFVRNDLGMWTRDFAIDPTQDLVAFLELDHRSKIKIHVHAASTMEIHPRAAKSPLVPEIPTSESLQQLQIGSCFLQIVGDIIGMFYWHAGHRLLVWNWQTGIMLVCQDEADLPLGCWDLTFLSPRAYMIACAGEAGSLDLYAIHEPSPSVKPPKRVLRLRLPELKAHRLLRTINTHSSPYLARVEALQTPFVQPQNNRIHLVQLQYGDLLPSYAMYIKNEYLLDLMDQMYQEKGVYSHVKVSPAHPLHTHFATPGAPEEPAPHEPSYVKYLPWSHWGPSNTRFLQQDLHFQWLRYVNGYRVAMPASADRPDPFRDSRRHTELCVYDFNVYPQRVNDPCNPLMDLHRQRQLAAGEEPSWSYEVNSTPTTLPDKDVFAAPVVSTLPYAVSRRTGVYGYTGFMIDEQRLIGMKDNAFDGSSSCDIDVFTL